MESSYMSNSLGCAPLASFFPMKNAHLYGKSGINFLRHYLGGSRNGEHPNL